MEIAQTAIRGASTVPLGAQKLQAINKELDSLSSTLSALETRMQPICTPRQPMPEAPAGVAAPTPTRSPFVAELDGVVNRIGDARFRIGRLVDTLEV